MSDEKTVYVVEDGTCYCDWCIQGGATGNYVDIDDVTENLKRLSDWHDNAHGLTLWAMCPHEPCRLLSDEFRSTP